MTPPSQLHTAHPARESPWNLPGGGGFFLLLFVLFIANSGWGELIEADQPLVGGRFQGRYRPGEDEIQVDEVFQSHLPGTLAKYALRLSLHPHLGDWEKKEYMRVTSALRYGLTEKCELTLGSRLWFSHGHGELRAFDHYGAASLKVGARFDLGQAWPGLETGAGFDYEFPTDHPPAQVTDGLRHFRPYVTFSHRFESRPNLRVFVGFRLDEVEPTDVPGEFGKNSFQESSTGITGGWVLDRDRWHYTFEASWDTNRFVGQGSEDIYSLRPGVLYEVPVRGKSWVRSNWLVGVAVNSTFGPGGSSQGASFKIRYSSDLKNGLRRHRQVMAPQ
ncbi:MAG TPA: hypothetical protein VG734_27260 [Lacunisphaera sp.]|nr:hypothetical protein [Lacunisphaera sp.]